MPKTSSIETTPFDARITFGTCRLDRLSQRLERDGVHVHLEPKVWQLLCFLLERPGRVVPKDELVGEIWPGVAVADGSLNRLVALLRRALGDSAQTPQYIETVHRRGFRFVAEVSGTVASMPAAPPPLVASGPGNERFVGRSDSLGRLGEAFAQISAGARQVVFVEGEAGIGKTALIDQFLQTLPKDARQIGGRCIEHHATAEPYHPILNAVERLARTGGDSILDVLRLRAPSWLAQMPWLTGESPSPGQGDPTGGASGPRMLRELAVAIEEITKDVPLVWVLEDLHWSDPATIDFLHVIANREEATQLLLIATYRGAHAIAYGHPLLSVVHALRRNGRCQSLSLEPLTRPDIEDYLSRRFENAALTAAVAPALQERTDGNPLFLTTMVDHLVDTSWIKESGTRWELGRPIEDLATSDVPEDLRMTIELQLTQLGSDAFSVLSAASVMGERFAVDAIATSLDRDAAVLEPLLEQLSQRWHIIRRADGLERWPDGTTVSYYYFRHALYRAVLYDKLAPIQRTHLHQKIGERLETAFAGETSRVCAELAGHFACSGDAMRCVLYSLEAANQARWRFANREAEAFFATALGSVEQLGGDPVHLPLELLSRMGLALTRLMRQEDATAGDEENFAAIEQLCLELQDDAQRFRALDALFRIESLRRRTDLAAPVAEVMVSIAERLADPRRSIYAYFARGSAQMHRGDFDSAIETMDTALAIYREGLPARHAGVRRHQLKWSDDGLWISVVRAGTLVFLGRFHEALEQVKETVALASGDVPPLSAGTALLGSCVSYYLLGKLAEADRVAEHGLSLAMEEEIVGMQAAFEVARWCIGLRAGTIQADDPDVLVPVRSLWDENLRDKFSTPYPVGPFFYVDGCLQVGAHVEGLRVLEELLLQTRATQTTWFECELLRLQGELVRLSGADDSVARAEESFHRARAVALEQHTPFGDLRTSLSLARLGRDPRQTWMDRISTACRFFDAQPDVDAPDILEARNLLPRNPSS